MKRTFEEVLFQLVLYFLCWLTIPVPQHTQAFFAVNNNNNRPHKPPPSSPNNSIDIMSLAAAATSDKKNDVDDATAEPKKGVLRIHGPDANGIVAAFSQLLYGHGCGIMDSEQHTDHSAKLFFQRIHFDYSKMHTDKITLQAGIQEVCQRFSMKSQLNWGDKRKTIALMVSKYDHCLWELLLRHRVRQRPRLTILMHAQVVVSFLAVFCRSCFTLTGW